METQLEIFPVTKNIPQWLAEYFNKANAGNYANKELFYTKIKPFVLRTFGGFVGYDLQIIEKKCHSCNGTGVFKRYSYDGGVRYLIGTEPCWNCLNGIYLTKKITLERYILNGTVYHIPLINYLPGEPYKNEIKGIITHDPVDPEEANRAFIILLWKYSKSDFYQYVLNNIKTHSSKVASMIQDLFRKDNTNDELPF